MRGIPSGICAHSVALVSPMTEPVARRILPMPSPPVSWAEVQQAVRVYGHRECPLPRISLAQVFGVRRGQAWRWLERLERAGLVTVTEDPPNAQGVRKKRR